MKCKYCGGEISLEDVKCPYCGRENEEAVQHIKDMQYYQGEFEKAKHKVYHESGQAAAITVRVIVCALLVIFSILLLVLGGNAYSFIYSVQSKNADAHVAEYSKILDQYLEEENFQAFSRFIQEKGIRTYGDVYGKYSKVRSLADTYNSVWNDILDLYNPPAYSEFDRLLDMFSDDLDYFYNALERETWNEGEDAEIYLTAADRMEENVQLLIRTYLGLTDEQAQSLKSLSKGRRAVLIEDALGEK